MEGWVLYKRPLDELTERDHGVNRLLEAAKKLGVVLKVYTPEQLDVLVTSSSQNQFVVQGSSVKQPDFVIPRVGANVTYSGLALLRQFEHQGVLVCNSSNAISLSKDKLRMMQHLNQAHIPVPKTLLMKFPSTMAWIKQEIGFPLVIKLVSSNKGFGVHLCESPNALEEIMEILSIQLQQKPIILQEYIEDSYGRDLRVFVMGGKVLGCIKRTSSDGFRANYSRGGDVRAFEVTPEIERLALDTANLFDLDITGVDLLFDGEGFQVCEANSAPGFKGIEAVYDVDVAEAILQYILQKKQS